MLARVWFALAVAGCGSLFAFHLEVGKDTAEDGTDLCPCNIAVREEAALIISFDDMAVAEDTDGVEYGLFLIG